MACVSMARIGVASAIMAHIVRTYTVMAYVVMAFIAGNVLGGVRCRVEAQLADLGHNYNGQP